MPLSQLCQPPPVVIGPILQLECYRPVQNLSKAKRGYVSKIPHGTHTLAKKGSEAVAYQGRKKAKTSNIPPIADENSYIVAMTDITMINLHHILA